MTDKKTALIIVDVQPTFCEGGELGVAGGAGTAEAIRSFVERDGARYDVIATTQDWHIEPGDHWSDSPDFVDTWPRHGVAGTSGAALHPAIAGLPVRHHIKKGQYSAAYSGFEGIEDNTDRIQSRQEVQAAHESGRTLERLLRDHGVERVDVVGIALSHCVKDTALDAARMGFDTRVYKDLSVPVSAELGERALEQLAAHGVAVVEGDSYAA